MCFWGTPEFKKVINVIVHLHIVFKSLQMLLSLRIHLPFFEELKFCELGHIELKCDNQSTVHLSSNPVFHED